MMQAAPEPQKRKRLPPEVRRVAMIEAASRQTLEQGSLPLSPEAIARQVGASKALIYSYFPTQYDLMNAVLLSCLQDLEAEGLWAALSGPTLNGVAVLAGLIYFEHVARRGPLLHLIMSDLFMAGRLDREVARIRDRVYLRLAHMARRELNLDRKATLVAVNLVMTIPEEAGRRVVSGDMEHEVGRKLVRQLVASAVDGLRPDR
jgi:AcrR family transcriptional regulator